jgi:glycosyltransferase involved in cell wall biosynthesis
VSSGGTAAAPVSGERPLVSIVVPVLDGERHLRESLDSIVRQTYPRTEILLMDDGSSDATPAIATSFGERVGYRRQPTRRGIYANANDGIALAGGELIAVYHADDVYEPEIVEREVAYLERHPEVGAVFAKDIFVDADGRPFGRLELPAAVAGGQPLDYGTLLETLLRHKNNFLRCPSSMVRASVYRELGGYDQERFKNTSDLEMWLRIARRHRIGIVDEHLFRYRRGHGSSSERYHSLRAEPERFFVIMDRELEQGGRALVSASALAAYEGHRAEDQLKLAASKYVLGERPAGRAAIAGASARTILRSGHPRRARLLALLAIVRCLVALPRLRLAAALLRRQVFGPTTAVG